MKINKLFIIISYLYTFKDINFKGLT